MTEFILCVVTLVFLGWVIVLKAEIAGLKNDKKKMRDKFERLLKKATGNVDIETIQRPRGRADDDTD